MPLLDPWDPSIVSYYQKPDELVCKPLQKSLAELKDGVLYVRLAPLLKNAQIDSKSAEGLVCRYREVRHANGESDFDAAVGPYHEIDGISAVVPYEFFEVGFILCVFVCI